MTMTTLKTPLQKLEEMEGRQQNEKESDSRMIQVAMYKYACLHVWRQPLSKTESEDDVVTSKKQKAPSCKATPTMKRTGGVVKKTSATPTKEERKKEITSVSDFFGTALVRRTTQDSFPLFTFHLSFIHLIIFKGEANS